MMTATTAAPQAARSSGRFGGRLTAGSQQGQREEVEQLRSACVGGRSAGRVRCRRAARIDGRPTRAGGATSVGGRATSGIYGPAAASAIGG